MAKIITAVSLMFIFGGGWFALDYLNKQEQARAIEIHKGIEQARLESKSRLEKRANFEAVIHSIQSECEATADKAQDDYLALMLKTIPAKRKVPNSLPQTVVNKAEIILHSAKTECLRITTEKLSVGI
ncbi:MAG: hypothetical protein ACOH1I_04240 [Gallionellaceae bacterium]|jgi:hypothetical protein